MGIFSSISNAISRTTDQVSNTANVVEKTLNVAHDYVDIRAKKFAITDKKQVALDLALTLADIDDQLEDDAKLKQYFIEATALLEV